MHKCFLALLLLFLYFPVCAQTSSELFREVNLLFGQGKSSEASALFVRATDSLYADDLATSQDKIAALLAAYKLVELAEGRNYLLRAVELAINNNQHDLVFDEIEEIKDYYERLSIEEVEFYEKIKLSSYNYTSINLPVYKIDSLSKTKFEVAIMLSKAFGIQSQKAYLNTELEGKWYQFDCDLKEYNDSLLVYTVDVSEYNDFKGLGKLLLLEVNSRIPDFGNSFIEELYIKYHAKFLGNYHEILQGIALLYSSDYEKIKPIYDAFYVAQISEVLEAYEGDSVLALNGTTGAFKGETLGEIFEDVTYEDLNLFLDFVSDFPGKYLGKQFKMSETFATWIINNAPLSFNSLTRYFLNSDKRNALFNQFKQEIKDDGLLDFWVNKAEDLAKKFKYQEALQLEKLVYDACSALDIEQDRLKAASRISELYQDLNHFQAAKKYSQIASGNLHDTMVNGRLSQKMNLVVQYNHTMPYHLEYHPSGRYYYTSSWDGKIKVWDANLNKLIREYRAHSDMIQAMEVKLNGKHLLTGDWTGRIKIWEIKGSELKEIRSIKHEEDINEVHFCNADKTSIIAYCGRTNFVHLYDWEKDKKRIIRKHTATVSALSFNDGGTFLYSGGRDSFIYKWPIHLLFDDWDADLFYTHWYKEPAKIYQIDLSPNSLFMSVVRSDSIAALWDVQENKSLGTVNIHMFLTGDMVMYSPTTFDPIDKFFVFTNDKNKLSIVDLASLNMQSFNHGMGELVSDIDFHPSGNILALTGYYNSETEFMDLTNFDVLETSYISINTPKFTSSKAYKINFDASGNHLISQLSLPSGPMLTSLNLTNGKNEVIQKGLYHVSTTNSFQNAFVTWNTNEIPVFLKKPDERIEYEDDTLAFSNLNYFLDDQQEILYTFDNETSKTLSAYSLNENKMMFEVKLDLGDEKNWNCGLTVSFGEILVTNGSKKLYRFDANTGVMLKPIRLGFRNAIFDVKRLNNGNIAVESQWSLALIDGKSKKKIWKYRYRKWKDRNEGKSITTYKISDDQKYLTYGTYKYKIYLRDATNKFEVVLEDSSSNWFINDVAFHPTKSILAFCNEENKIRLIDYNDSKVLVDLYPQSTGSYIWVNSNNFYWAGKQDLENIAFEIGGKIYPSEQFDITFNRPDKILQELPFRTPSFLDALQLASQKRLSRIGGQILDVTSFPNVNIKNKASIPILTNENEISIKVEAFDFQNLLKKFIISVNGVLVSNTIISGNEWDSIIQISLTNGENSIKVWVENKNGIRSLKEGFEIKCNYKMKSNLFLFTMSVSEYQDSTYNLNYAVKDGQDLVKVLISDSNNYDSIIVNAFYNEAVTKNVLYEISEVLKNAQVNDQVILFISGHGLLDNNYDFYFAGHDCDFNNPSTSGISYSSIEHVLEKTKARKRLLLMDACHSGEVDKDAIFTSDTTLLLANGKKSGIKSYSYKGAGIGDDVDTTLGLNNSFELMKELFSDFNSNGTQVISAAAGNSYALESKEWENGVFTYSILDGLINMNADLNNDGEIRISELKKYVSAKVFDLTLGQQRPTTREENIEFDFKIW